MKTITLIISAAIIIFCSCTRDKSTRYEGYLINKTSMHSIQINFYRSGFQQTISLNPNDSIKIANGSLLGEITNPGFMSDYFGGPNDSVVIVFDNQYPVSHYFNTPTNLASKYLLFTSLRNIGNPKSYVFVRKGILNSHYYLFTEQDYLDAK